MMNKGFFLLFVICHLALSPSLLRAQQKKFLPFYRFTFGEGVSLPSKGDFFASQDIGSQIGSVVKPLDRLQIFGLYDLTYEGPGLMRSEGRLFTERAMRHSFMLEPSVEAPFVGTVRLKGFGIKENRRSGTNEIWGKGLYDYQATGFSFGIDKEFFGFRFSPAWRFTKMIFPNYTDLLREFQSGGLNAELAGGLMNQNVQAISLGISRKPFRAGASLSAQKYKKEKVVSSGGTYLNENQKDETTEFTADFDARLWRISLVPNGAYRMKRSNQNYLRFAYFGDTNPTFIAKNYDYNEMSLGARLYLHVTKTKALFGSMSLNDRIYPNRAPRNTDGVYALGEKQKTTWGAWGGGLQWKVSDYSTWNLAYNMVYSKSNMKYERFIPYNYTGHLVGLYLTVAP
ncbi:hypothetical protein HY772_03420 [Candidatus Woesearchaeota archaeon]|nr:hypothetical protein [Candidatus Woesearchaeota archaeon]